MNRGGIGMKDMWTCELAAVLDYASCKPGDRYQEIEMSWKVSENYGLARTSWQNDFNCFWALVILQNCLLCPCREFLLF